jgi:hypothetical protein
MRIKRGVFAWALAMVCLVGPATGASQDPRPFALAVHVAASDQREAASRISRFVETANSTFVGAGIAFGVGERHPLPDSFIVLDNIRERRQLRKFFVPRAINIFIVDQILDPNPSAATRRAARWQGRAPSGRLSGAHIPIKGRTPGTYIILARSRSRVSLAHELGHFFGAPHSKDPQNIMSYGSGRVRFSDKQLKIFRIHARRYRRARAVQALPVVSTAQSPARVAERSWLAGPWGPFPAHRGPRL